MVATLKSIPEVIDIHDIHIWSLTSNRNAMSGHVVVEGSLTVKQTQTIICRIEDLLDKKYRIGHVSIQVEVIVITRIKTTYFVRTRNKLGC